MKLFKYLAVTVLSAFAVVACATGDEEPVHTNNTITAISISSAEYPNISVDGVIDEDNQQILFPIPRNLHVRFSDLTRLNVRATAGFDARFTPALTGLHDLSEPFLVTVTAGNGDIREYTLQAYYSREGEE